MHSPIIKQPPVNTLEEETPKPAESPVRDFRSMAESYTREIRDASHARNKAIDILAAQGKMTEVLEAHPGTDSDAAHSLMNSLEEAGKHWSAPYLNPRLTPEMKQQKRSITPISASLAPKEFLRVAKGGNPER